MASVPYFKALSTMVRFALWLYAYSPVKAGRDSLRKGFPRVAEMKGTPLLAYSADYVDHWPEEPKVKESFNKSFAKSWKEL